MAFYFLEPEVPGGLGEGTEWDRTTDPYEVVKLHYEMQGWMGDELITSSPVYMVGEQVAKALQQANLSGFTLAPMTLSFSDQFRSRYAAADVPGFVWLKLGDRPMLDDFGRCSRASGATTPKPVRLKTSLLVSGRALDVLKQFRIEQCEVEEVQG